MNVKTDTKAQEIMVERFGHDTLLSVATMEDGKPYVRIVNAYYEDGCFYIITHAFSNKIKQIEKNPIVAVCGDWFTGHGIGENLGYICSETNLPMLKKLREVYASWYGNGDVNESDPNMCLLRIRLTDGVLFNHGTRYELDFGD